MEELSLTEFGMRLFWAVIGFFDHGELISYQNILIPLAIAMLIAWRMKANPIRYFFDKTVWRSKSVQLDMLYYLLIVPMGAFLVIPLFVTVQLYLNVEGVALLEHWFGPAAAHGENGLAEMALYSLLMFLCLDFGFFISHYASHKWKLIWCFHKVHHSAEKLVFFSAMRFHPFDIAWNVGASLALTGVVGALCQYSFYSGEEVLELFGNHIIVGLSYLTTHNLRHSHIWLHYPRWLRFLMSPAQHQLHHSMRPQHIDRNFGYLLTCWDQWFGTLYEPKEQEPFETGVVGMASEGPRTHDSVWKLLTVPFRDAYDVLAGRKR